MKKLLTAGSLITLLFCLSTSGQDASAAESQKRSVSYGLVIDNSGSIRTLLDRVITVVSEVIEGNHADDEAFLLTFVDTPKISLRQEFTSSKSELHDAAQNMFVEGGQTAILDAVKISAEYLGKNARTGANRSRALIVVTDGEDRGSGSKVEDVVRLLKDTNIRVYVIAMSDGKIFTKLIDKLTKETSGAKFEPKVKADFAAIGTRVSSAIRTK